MKRWLCKVRLHDWGYFVDGFVGRSCNRAGCNTVQYDLPGPRPAPSNKDRNWLG